MIVDFPEKRSPGARLDLKGMFGFRLQITEPGIFNGDFQCPWGRVISGFASHKICGDLVTQMWCIWIQTGDFHRDSRSKHALSGRKQNNLRRNPRPTRNDSFVLFFLGNNHVT